MEDLPARTLPESPNHNIIVLAALKGKIERQIWVRQIVVQFKGTICRGLTRGDYIIDACSPNKRKPDEQEIKERCQATCRYFEQTDGPGLKEFTT